MSINLSELVALLRTQYPVFRDEAPIKTNYPYIVYTYIESGNNWASSRLYRQLPSYQFALFTTGTEKDTLPIVKILSDNRIPFDDFQSFAIDENDRKVTNFFTEIRVNANG